jgi:hypothetical protein
MAFFVMTPACTACDEVFYSALKSLPAANCCSMSSNAEMNCVVAVCACHLCALELHSSSYSPSMHLYTILEFSTGGVLGAPVVLGGWVERLAAESGTPFAAASSGRRV